MLTLITTLSSSISLLCGFLMFLYLMHQIEVADPESNLHIYSREEGFGFMIEMLISNILVCIRFTSIIDRIFFMLMFGIMIVHAHTDKKTKTVYRPFNYILWIIGIIYTAIKLILKDFPQANEGWKQTLVFIGIFIFIVWIFTFIFHTSGKGDGYMLIGLAFFVSFLSKDTPFISLIITLVFYIIAGILQVIINIKQFQFKKLRFKEKIPFAPSMLFGLWGILIVSYLCASNSFNIWYINHLIL